MRDGATLGKGRTRGGGRQGRDRGSGGRRWRHGDDDAVVEGCEEKSDEDREREWGSMFENSLFGCIFL